MKRRRGSGTQLGPAVSDDLVQRNRTATRSEEVWHTDITEHGTGKVYVYAAKDVCSRRIDGWSIGHRQAP